MTQSGRDPLVVMMESAKLGDFRNPPSIAGMSLASFRRVHLKGLVGPPSMVVAEVVGEDLSEVPLAEYDRVIQAFASDTPDQPLDLRALPRRLWSDQHFLHAQAGDSLPERHPADPVTVAQQVLGRVGPGGGLDDLLGRPLSRRVGGHIEVQDAPTLVGEDQEDEEDLVLLGRHDEEVGLRPGPGRGS